MSTSVVTRAVHAMGELAGALRGSTPTLAGVTRALRATGVDFGVGMLRLEELLAPT
jgi:hypothetical protein